MSGTPSLSVSSGQGRHGRCRPGGANSNECPSALAAQVMEGGAILVPTYTHVHGSAGQVPCNSARCTPTPTQDAQERSDTPPPRSSSREVGPGFLLNARSTPECSPSAPQPLILLYVLPPRLLNATLSFAIPAFFTMGASWRRNVSHSRACSCVTTHARAMPISQFAVSSALPRVRHPPGCPGRAQASKADSQSRRCPASLLLISSSQLDPSVASRPGRGRSCTYLPG